MLILTIILWLLLPLCDGKGVDVCPAVIPTDVGSAAVTVTIYRYIDIYHVPGAMGVSGSWR